MIAFVAGALTWTLLEYLIHRWMGHDRRFKRTPFGVEHIRHHIEGNYFAPSWKKVLFALGLAVVLVVLAGIAYTVGLLASYALYEVLHRRYHTHAGFGAYGRWARRHHFHHHFVDGRKNRLVCCRSQPASIPSNTAAHGSSCTTPRGNTKCTAPAKTPT